MSHGFKILFRHQPSEVALYTGKVHEIYAPHNKWNLRGLVLEPKLLDVRNNGKEINTRSVYFATF